MFTIYNADCLEALRELPDGCADAILMDPPYSNLAPSRGQSAKARALAAANPFGAVPQFGLDWLMREVARESVRLVKPEGSLLCFCDDKMLVHLVPVIESCGPEYAGFVVWDKVHLGMGSGFRKQHEVIARFTYGTAEYHDSTIPDVIQCKRVTKRRHQNQKPLPLLRRLIRVVCPEGGTVLDPFMGIGITGLACLSEGRNFIGVEVHRGHCDKARWLLEQHGAALAARNGAALAARNGTP
jgi:site-specific DNA-methyltransferase (adenine-specific)